MTRLEYPYYSVPRNVTVLSYREITERAGWRLPYVVGEYKHPTTGRYRPDYVEFMLITGGAGYRTAGDAHPSERRRQLTAGQLYVFRPMDVQEIAGVGAPGLSVICITFPVETWERFLIVSELDQRPFSVPDAPMIHVDLEDPAILRPFRRILKAWRRRVEAIDLIRFLTRTAPWFVEAARAEETTGIPKWLNAAVAAMHEEDNLRAGVARLTELSHVSHTHLWRSTRAYFGVTPSELVADIRFHYAALLLTSTDKSIAEIADRCGYSSQANFSTAFRRSRLLTPRDYRAQSRVR